MSTEKVSNEEVDLYKTFDARDWAKEFCRINPGADYETMITWFANALMMGWDEHRFRSKEYKREIRRILVPAWKRWLTSARKVRALMTSWKVWLHGLAAALVSAFFSAVAGTLALPTVFAFDTRNGWANLVKLATPPAILAVALYLKNSPIPSLTVTSQTDKETAAGSESTKSTVTVTKN